MNLIVMGGIGATGLERFLLGSVADKVVRSSRIPVLVVRKE
jgi:nucleotide-binding universal stress UspA family protein